MKRKIIRAFLAIYLVLSMAYSGIRAAYITVMAAIAPPDNVEEQIELASASFGIDTVPAEPERDSAELPPPVIQVEDVPEETVRRVRRKPLRPTQQRRRPPKKAHWRKPLRRKMRRRTLHMKKRRRHLRTAKMTRKPMSRRLLQRMFPRWKSI